MKKVLLNKFVQNGFRWDAKAALHLQVTDVLRQNVGHVVDLEERVEGIGDVGAEFHAPFSDPLELVESAGHLRGASLFVLVVSKILAGSAGRALSRKVLGCGSMMKRRLRFSPVVRHADSGKTGRQFWLRMGIC